MKTIRVSGDVERARSYQTSVSEIQWTGCCSGVICGSARRVGLDNSTNLAVYRLSGFRHPELNGVIVVVTPEGELVHVGDLSRVEVRGCVWRPADVSTNGVTYVSTRGKADTWPRPEGQAPRFIWDALRTIERELKLHNHLEALYVVDGYQACVVDEGERDVARGVDSSPNLQMALNSLADAIIAKGASRG